MGGFFFAMSHGKRGVWAFALIGLFSGIAGLIILPVRGIDETIPLHLAYPLLATVLGIQLFTLRHWAKSWVVSIGRDRWLMAAILLVTLWLLSAEPFMFKIVNDEGLIASTAQSFHTERAAAVSSTGSWSKGQYETFEGFIDKRPLLMPFLTSILHDLTGYRVANVFILNGLLTLILIGLIAYVLRWLTDRRSAILGLILLAFLPVLAQGATSGNASILNGLMLTTAIALGMRYWDSPEEFTLPPLVYSLILLAQTRYESILYVVPFGLLILFGWIKAGRIVLTPLVIIAPLFLIFNAWHLRYAMAYEAFYVQDGPNARDAIFSLNYLLPNLRETLVFLFSFNNHHPNSPLLSLGGIAGVGVVIIHIVKKTLNQKAKAAIGVLLMVAVTNLGVILCFNFGIFTNYITARLSLPICLLLTFFAALGFYQDKRLLFRIFILLTAIALVSAIILSSDKLGPESAIRFVLGVFVLVTVYVGLATQAHRFGNLLPVSLLIASVALIAPKLRTYPYLQYYAPAIGVLHVLDFVKEERGRDVLFVSWNPIYPILLNANTLDPRRLPDAVQLREAVESGHYRKIYLVDSLDPVRSGVPSIPVPNGFKRFPVLKRRLAQGYFFEVTEWRLSPGPLEENTQQDKVDRKEEAPVQPEK
jgi:hypothetical protein